MRRRASSPGASAESADLTIAPRPARARPARPATMPCCPFEVDALDVRGRAIQMGPALDAILARHDYPDAGLPAARRGGRARRPPRLVAEIRRQVHPADRDRRAGRHAGRRLPHRRRPPRLCALRRGARSPTAERAGEARRARCSARAPRHDRRPGRPYQPLPGRRGARGRQPRGGGAHLFPPVGADPDARPPRGGRDAAARERRAAPAAGGPAA